MATASYRVVTSRRINFKLQWVTVGYSKLPSGYSKLLQVTEWLQWVTARYSGLQWVTVSYCKLPSGYSKLQQVTVGYSKIQWVTASYSGLLHVTKWLQQVTEVTVGYSKLQWVTASYRVVTASYCKLPSGYNGLQQDTVGYSGLQ